MYKARFYVTRKSPPYLAVLFLISLSISYILQRNMEFWISYEQQNRIYLLQKRTVRTICAADYRAPSKPLFQKVTILTFIVCFHSKLDPSCICTPWNVTCLISKLIYNFKLKVKSIVILLDRPIHTALMPTEDTWKNLRSYTKDRNCGTGYLTQ